MEKSYDYDYYYDAGLNISGFASYQYNESNLTYTYDEVQVNDYDSSLETWLQIVLALFTAFLNLLVFFVVISDKTLRTSPKYIHVLNLSFSDLVYSVAVLPFLVEFNMNNKWVHSCELRLFVDLYDTSFHPAFTWLALSMLNIVLLFMICTTLFDKRTPRPYIAIALMIIPWVMTCLAFIPLFRSVVEPMNIRGHPCMYTISPHRHVALLLLTYPLMCLFLVMTSFLTIVLVLYRRNVAFCGGKLPSRGDDRVPRGDPEDERREYMCDVIVVSILAVLLSCPVFIVQMYFKIKNGQYNCFGEGECNIYILSSRAVYLLRLSRCAIVPAFWFLGRDFRYAFLQLIKRKKVKEID